MKNKKYKIGYFYNITRNDTHKNRVVVTFEKNSFTFKLIDPNILPELHYTSIGYYSFDHPIIYNEDSLGNIVNLKFLSDIPIRCESEIVGHGWEIFVPFFGFENSNNPCKGENIKSQIYLCDIFGTKIFNNGKEIVEIDDIQNNLFYNISLLRFVLNKIVNSIWYDSFDLRHPRIHNNYKFYTETLRTITEYVDSFNIKDILSDLFIEVNEYFHTKPGDDDRYSVYRKAKLSSNIANNDFYLRNIIGIGEKCIYQDSGFCSAQSMRIPDLVTGVYKGKKLKEEKQKIISSYSRQEHISHLLADIYSSVMKNMFGYKKWCELLDICDNCLVNYFNFEKIFRSRKGSSKVESKFYSIETPYEKNPQAIIDEINNIILNETKCDISEEECNSIRHGLKNTYNSVH